MRGGEAGLSCSRLPGDGRWILAVLFAVAVAVAFASAEEEDCGTGDAETEKDC
jgi:hypothetical protein